MHIVTSSAPDVTSAGSGQVWLQRLRRRWQGHWRPTQLALVGDLGGVDGVLAAFEQWCQDHEGSVCEVGLSSRWLRLAVASPLESAEQGWERALAQWAQLDELDAATLAENWRVRQVRVPRLHLCCAVPRELVDGLLARAKAHRVRIDALGPWWARGLARVLARPVTQLDRHLVLQEPGWITQVQIQVDADQVAVQALWSEPEGANWPAGAQVMSWPRLPGHDAAQGALDDVAVQAVLKGDPRVWLIGGQG